MKAPTPIRADIVLVGGGHAHVAVLKRFGMRPVPGVRLTLVTRDALTPYSGMLPGLIAGHYTHDEAHLDLRKLAAFAGARIYHSGADGIDLARRLVFCADRPPVPYDVLSIDIGSTPRTAGIDGARKHALPTKPVDAFLVGLDDIAARAEAHRGFRLSVIGGGAGGVELALSLRHRLREVPDLSVTVLTDSATPLPSHSPAVQRLVADFARRAEVEIVTETRVERVAADHVKTANGRSIAHDAAILVTDGAPAAWLAGTGLALNDRGFIRTGVTLESPSHPGVFAAGDVAAIDGHPLPRAGVYAVRQGPVLAENLVAAALGRPLRRYKPQRRILALISNGQKHALASYGPLAFDGAWVWRWKDWIDRRWMRKYQELPEMAADDAPDAAPMRCGGCGAKVPSGVLARALAAVRPAGGDNAEGGVLLGLEAPDDAAVIAAPPGLALVQSVDHFRPFTDDPYLFARIAANHCLGDLHAMGATPHSAQLSLTLPYGPEDKTEALLTDLLRGTLATLDEAGATLVGGHTGEGPELSLGLTVNGFGAPDKLLRKGGLRIGDALVLTKALGTGVVFAADMAAKARAGWIDAALASMLRPNGEAAAILRAHGATAMTDVTGFGLAGHLIEMTRAGNVGTTLDVGALPLLPGAADLLGQGIRSTLHPANEGFAVMVDGDGPSILYDPQTAGGLLAGVPASCAEACVTALHAAGDTEAAVIGEVVAATGAPIRLTCTPPASRAINEAADD